jgi:hypothetical protein
VTAVWARHWSWGTLTSFIEKKIKTMATWTGLWWVGSKDGSMTWLSRKSLFVVANLCGVIGSCLPPWLSLIGCYIQWIGKGYSLTVCYRALLRKTLIIALWFCGCTTAGKEKRGSTFNLSGWSWMAFRRRSLLLGPPFLLVHARYYYSSQSSRPLPKDCRVGVTRRLGM